MNLTISKNMHIKLNHIPKRFGVSKKEMFETTWNFNQIHCLPHASIPITRALSRMIIVVSGRKTTSSGETPSLQQDLMLLHQHLGWQIWFLFSQLSLFKKWGLLPITDSKIRTLPVLGATRQHRNRLFSLLASEVSATCGKTIFWTTFRCEIPHGQCTPNETPGESSITHHKTHANRTQGNIRIPLPQVLVKQPLHHFYSRHFPSPTVSPPPSKCLVVTGIVTRP